MAKTLEPVCKYCAEPLSVKHIFTCKDETTVENRMIFKIDQWENDLFDETKMDDIIHFLKEEDYYNLI